MTDKLHYDLGYLEYTSTSERRLKLSCFPRVVLSSPHSRIFPFSEIFKDLQYILSCRAYITSASLIRLCIQLQCDDGSSGLSQRFGNRDRLAHALSRLEVTFYSIKASVAYASVAMVTSRLAGCGGACRRWSAQRQLHPLGFEGCMYYRRKGSSHGVCKCTNGRSFAGS